MLFLLNWDRDRALMAPEVPDGAGEFGVEAFDAEAAAAAAAAAVIVEAVEEANEVEDDAEGEFRRQVLGFWPAIARASVMLLEMVMPLACCCCFRASKLFAELEEENLSRELAVRDAVRPDFLATLVRREQLLKEAEFLTWVVLLILSGTVQAALKEADRCTGTPEGSTLDWVCCCCCCVVGPWFWDDDCWDCWDWGRAELAVDTSDDDDE